MAHGLMGDIGCTCRQQRDGNDSEEIVAAGRGVQIHPVPPSLSGSILPYPNRFNGLYNAGLAAERSGEQIRAAGYYAALLQSTGNGAHSTRPELDHAKAFAASAR
jgi:hypothetical protein